jgi:3-oxoacyl-[acyl-carrier protein] reductase
MDLQINGKNALVTGSTKGIGRAIAELLAAEGCNLGICSRNAEDVDKAITELSAHGVKVVGSAVDISDAQALGDWVESCAGQLGGVDTLVANVSAGGGEVNEETWRNTFEVDLMGTVRSVNAARPHLEKSSCGSIVIISSTAAIEAFMGAGPYAALKAALLNYSGNLAQDLAGVGIRVNAVSPGPILVEGGAWDNIRDAMPEIYTNTVAAIPIGRMGTAAEVASQVALLASPLSGNTTGTNIVIDGGFTKGLQF